MSFAQDLCIELHARLRLACEAIGCQPEDVQLGDVNPQQRSRLLALAQQDLWQDIQADSLPLETPHRNSLAIFPKAG